MHLAVQNDSQNPSINKAQSPPGLRAASLRGLNCFELRPLLLAGVSTAMLAASMDTTPAMLLPGPSLLQVLQLLRSLSPSCTQRRQAAISRSAPAVADDQPEK